MKSSNLPPLRVEPSFRADIEGVLEKDESLSSFVEGAVRRAVHWRKTQSDFMSRGLGALAQVEAGAATHSAESVMQHLQGKLDQALAARKPGPPQKTRPSTDV